MNQITDNPYVAPAAELEVEHAAGDLSVFKRFTTWGVFGLSIITLGLYTIYWLYSRSQKLNQITDAPISQGFIGTATAVYVLSFFFSFVVPFVGVSMENMGLLVMIDSLLSLTSIVLFIVWSFKFRNRLNRVTQSAGKPTWSGPIMTFFFNVLYLNYKVNQNIDRRG